MNRYSAVGVVVGSKYLGEVEVENREEAKEAAFDLPTAYVSVCHQCARDISDPEIQEVEVELIEGEETWPAKWAGKTWAAGNHPRITEADLSAVYATIDAGGDPAKCFPNCGGLTDSRPMTALRLLKRAGLIFYDHTAPNNRRHRWAVIA